MLVGTSRRQALTRGFFTNKSWMSGLIDYSRGLHAQVSLILMIVVRGRDKRPASSLPN
jgi:hypothetical protein